MKKPSVYLDTTIFSVYWYRRADLMSQKSRAVTRDWWKDERHHFELVTSVAVLNELSDGIYSWQKESIRMARRVRFLPITGTAWTLSQLFLDESVIPRNKPGDAQQLAIATVHQIDYLLTWNYAHLANSSTQRKLELLAERTGFVPPSLVSPESIPQVRFGMDPRRR